MRPHGDVRMALRTASEQLQTPFTWRDLATRACVGWDAARATVRNMERAGEFVQRGHVSVPGINRPMALYERPSAQAAQSAGVALAACWAEFV